MTPRALTLLQGAANAVRKDNTHDARSDIRALIEELAVSTNETDQDLRRVLAYALGVDTR